MTRSKSSQISAAAMVALAWLAGAAGLGWTQDLQVGRLGPDRPDEAGFQPRREAFDCAFRDTFSTADLDTFRGDTTGGPALLTGYACRAWTESGPEHVFRLDVTTRVEFTARLDDLLDGDLDLILLGACDTDACLVQENTGFTAILEPGTYVLIVDGYLGSAGRYTLLMTARAPGVPAQVCAEGGAEPVAAPDGTTSLTGNLFGRPDLIHAYSDCSDLWHLAGEMWYAVTLPAAAAGEFRRVTVTATGVDPSLDLALWVFDDCGEGALCLDFADRGIGGEPETVNLENQDPTARVVLLAVDAFRPPALLLTGRFGLQFNVVVPVELRSLGGVKAGFR